MQYTFHAHVNALASQRLSFRGASWLEGEWSETWAWLSAKPGHLCLWCLTCSTTVPSCTLPGPTGQSSVGCWSWNNKHWGATVAPGRSLSLYGRVMALCLKDTGKEKQNSHQAAVRFPGKICYIKGENAKIRQTTQTNPTQTPQAQKSR